MTGLVHVLRRKGAGVLGRDFPATRSLLRGYQNAFGVPSFRAQIFWQSLLAFVEGPSRMRILDVGCGGGAFAIGIAKAFPSATITAIDRDPRALESARALATFTGVTSVEFVQTRFEEMSDESFDFVIALGVLEFAPDPRDWISRLIKHTTDEGVVIFTAPQRNGSRPTLASSSGFEIGQLELWMHEGGCSSIVVREIARGPNRAVYRASQAMQSHRWLGLALYPLTLPLVFLDGRLRGRGELLFCRGERLPDWGSAPRTEVSVTEPLTPERHS